jgi:uncharacterized membrane protein HdeD (DUF308 family)
MGRGGSTIGRLIPWWVVLIQGTAALVIGVLLVVSPAAATLTLVYFIGWWWLISGIFELGSIVADRTAWGWRVFSGILSILVGGYIVAAPLIGTVVVVGMTTVLLGISGMVIGALDVVKAFQGAGWGKGVIGILSFVLGAVIAFNWTEYMFALPWVWGVFAIAGGIASIVMSFSLRKIEHPMA